VATHTTAAPLRTVAGRHRAVRPGRPRHAIRHSRPRPFGATGGDLLLDNSFFILATSLVTGAGGFLFWTVNARLFSAAQVGLASALLGACSTIASCSLLGFNQTLVRRLPGSLEPSRLINTSLVLISAAGIVAASGYALIVPSFVPALASIRAEPAHLVAFVLLTALTGVNLATDSVFIAHQRARFNFAIDGLLQSAVKLALPPALVWLGAYGVFFSAGIATAAATVASLLVLVRRFGYRLRPELAGSLVRRDLAFSSGTYVAELLDLAPTLVLPLLIVRQQGPQAAAYFLIAFQIANLLYSGIYAVTQATFAAGCRDQGSLRALAVRSARMLLVLAPLGGLALAVAGPYVLGVIGPQYRAGGGGTLVVFSLGAVLVAPAAWSAALLKLTGQLGSLVAATVLRNGAVCLLAVVLLPRGLIGVAVAWVAGEAVSLIIPAWALTRRAVWKVRP
jgi:O-antigen/teichoic acid export membrane protein